MFILPIGNDDLKRDGIPLGTLTLAILAVTLHVATSGRIDRDARAAADAATRAAETYYSSPWATLPDALLPTLPAAFRDRYEKNRETTREFDASPEARRPPPTDAASQVIRQMEANAALAQASAGAGLDPTTDREVLRALLRATPPALREAGQKAVDAAAAELALARENSLVRRAGIARDHRGPLPLLAHPWLHGGWFHLGLNVLFLIVAGSSLESVWRRRTLVLCLVVSASAAGLAHAGFGSASAVPLIGLSGGVAGLMGAVVARLTSTPITVLWGYWAGTLRWGTFEVPAYLVLPLWFAGELFYALASQDAVTGTGHTAHVGGFLTGFLFAIAVRRSSLERRRWRPASAANGAPAAMPGASDAAHGRSASPRASDAANGGAADAPVADGGRPLTLYEQERARKRERWGIAASGGRGLAKVDPNASVMDLLPKGTQLLGGAPSRPPAEAPDAGPSLAAPETSAGAGAAVFGSLPTRPAIHMDRPARAAEASHPGESPVDPAAPSPALSVGGPPALAPAAAPRESLPERPHPALALAFRRPDDGPPEAIPTEGSALLPSLSSALRLDDSTIVARYCDDVRSGALTDLVLSPPEWLRLARALRERGLPGHAATIARRAYDVDTRGPYAARGKLLEAELLVECGDGAAALGCIELITSQYSSDPAVAAARRLRATLLGAAGS